MATFSSGIKTNQKISTKKDVNSYQAPIILTPDKYYTFGDGDKEAEYNNKINNARVFIGDNLNFLYLNCKL